MGKSDEVRRLLDERGVEHLDNDASRSVRYTRWDNGGKREVRYEEWSNGTTRLVVGNVTPEQAIAATVGNVGYGIEFADWCEFPPETMVGETVFDGKGNAIGWIVNAAADTCKGGESSHEVHRRNQRREFGRWMRILPDELRLPRMPRLPRQCQR